ncbi:isoprenyl transferase [Hyphococcus sp.]|uniref:isoprenyl transferase n=1 Tax=Hyphococcus sp. TaxID=2038636 RepID=UPI003D114317
MSAAPATSPGPAESGGASAPKHVAIIMDGNGRWAKARGLARTEGHKAGVEAARRAVEAARDLGLECLTLYSFSTENWRRPAGEVRDLMGLLRQFIVDDLPKLKKEGCKVVIIGDRDNLSMDLKALVKRAESETKDNAKFTLQIAFNYGGRDEIVRAARSLAEAVKSGALKPEDITEKSFEACLDTKNIPDPDLVIRTSGEKRISNYLLWQAAYAEYVFLDVLWPDFNKEVFAGAIEEYYRRERRYGGVGGN